MITPSMSMYRGDTASNFERFIELEEKQADELFESARELADDHDVSMPAETTVSTPARTISDSHRNPTVPVTVVR